MPELQVDGQQIYFEDQGHGPAVLLLHSSGLSSQQWRRLRAALEPHHRVLAPDLIGYGRSAPWAGVEPFQYPTDLAVAEAVAALAGSPIHVVGHSYGGFLALKIAARGKVSVASLAMFEPVAFGVLHSAGDEEGLRDLARADADGSFFAPEQEGTAAWCELFVDYWSGAGYWKRLPPPQQAAFAANGRKMFQEVRSLVQDRTPQSDYRHIEAPALLLSGTRSPPAGRRVAAILAETIPHARLETLSGAGHMGPLTHAERVSDLIVQHIEAAEAPART
jgi:pimeloyl-ACP methyl ester carboxylesterase